MKKTKILEILNKEGIGITKLNLKTKDLNWETQVFKHFNSCGFMNYVFFWTSMVNDDKTGLSLFGTNIQNFIYPHEFDTEDDFIKQVLKKITEIKTKVEEEYSEFEINKRQLKLFDD